MLAIALGLVSSVCWGTSDFLGGVQARRIPLLALMTLSQGIGLVGVALALAIHGQAPPPLVKLLPAAAAGIGGAAALAAFYRALAIGTMSIVAPISATGVAVPVAVGLASGNRPGALQLVGIVAAAVGVALASREQDSAAGQPVGRASIGLALLAAVGFGCYFVGMRASAQSSVLWALSSARLGSVVVLLAAAAVTASRPWPPAAKPVTFAALAVIGALDLAANGFYAVATRHGQLAIVAVVSALYPVATVALARGILREQVRRVQELGILVAITGVVLIAAG